MNIYARIDTKILHAGDTEYLGICNNAKQLKIDKTIEKWQNWLKAVEKHTYIHTYIATDMPTNRVNWPLFVIPCKIEEIKQNGM